MNMEDWAKNEIEIACKHERDWKKDAASHVADYRSSHLCLTMLPTSTGLAHR